MHDDEHIAVIGLAGRFPGASDVETFWSNITSGKVSVEPLSDEMLRAAGVPAERIRDLHYVKYASLIGDISRFDAGLFGSSRPDAEIRDPQHRIFLETCYSALEHAGLNPWRCAASIGVFAAGGPNRYAEQNIRRNARMLREFSGTAVDVGNNNDHLATFISYKLDLRGPALTVATACSSSLVAVHHACQALRNGECDVALAGGVQLNLPYGSGYLWEEGGTLSRSGRCRPFDAGADGTVFGNGAAAVVLKPLLDARRDGDPVLAVIRGSAVNNDGNRKVGITAPSVEGQCAAVYEALVVSGVDPADIGYVEGHGTGTSFGDSIEVQALTRAYREFTDRRGHCILSSVKGNIGHLGAASGVAGLVKAVLSISRAIAPGTAHFGSPNPLLDISESPLRITSEYEPWPLKGPRLAGVSSFGVGGTNAHVVIGEGEPVARFSASRRRAFVLPLAAASSAALERTASRVAEFWATTSDPPADVAHTLCRRPLHFTHRLAVVGSDADTVATALGAQRETPSVPVRDEPELVFLYNGRGTEHLTSVPELHACEPVYRREFERCLELFGDNVAAVLRRCLLDEGAQVGAAPEMSHVEFTGPALFAAQWALTALWESWAVSPEVSVGHGVGEIVAATVSGVFDLASAARFVVRSAQLLADLPGAAAPVVSLTGTDAETPDAGSALPAPLAERIAAELAELVAELSLSAPTVPWISTGRGNWITDEEAQSPDHWAWLLITPVCWEGAVECVSELHDPVVLEVGGGMLDPLAVERLSVTGTAMPPPNGHVELPAILRLYQAAAALWQRGLTVDWTQLTADEERVVVDAPGYAFDRQRYWVKPDEPERRPSVAARPQGTHGTTDPARADSLLSIPRWTESDSLPPSHGAVAGRRWLVLGGDGTETERIVGGLLAAGAVTARALEAEPHTPQEWSTMLQEELTSEEPLDVLCLGLTAERPVGMSDERAVTHWLDHVGSPLRGLLAALRQFPILQRIRCTVITTGLWDVSGAEPTEPGKAPVVALFDAAAESGEISASRVIDITLAPASGVGRSLVELLGPALAWDTGQSHERLAVRGQRRWSLAYQTLPWGLDAVSPTVQAGDVWLVAGGLDPLGLLVAEALAARAAVRLVLADRRGLPPREQWFMPGLLDEGRRQAVEAIERLEAAGASVLVLGVDTGDRDATAQALARIRSELGAIHGVVHILGPTTSGISEVDDPIDDATHTELRHVLDETPLLDSLLGDEPKHFLLLPPAGCGGADGAAVNAFRGAFARERARRRPGRTVAVGRLPSRAAGTDGLAGDAWSGSAADVLGGPLLDALLSLDLGPQVHVDAEARSDDDTVDVRGTDGRD